MSGNFEEKEVEEKDVLNDYSLGEIIIPESIDINNIIIYIDDEPHICKIHTIILLYDDISYREDEENDFDSLILEKLDILQSKDMTMQRIREFLLDKNLDQLRIQYYWEIKQVEQDWKQLDYKSIDDVIAEYNKLMVDSTHFKFIYSQHFNENKNQYALKIEIDSKNRYDVYLEDYLDKKSPLNKCFVIDLPSDFNIYNSVMVENTNMREYLQEEVGNIVFITLLNNNTYQGFATNVGDIDRRDSSIIVAECKEEGNATKYMKKDNIFFDKWYVRLGLDEHNNNKGIILDKLNSIREEFYKGNKIFFLSKERTLKTVSTISNIIINNDRYTNIYDEQIDITSGVHCNDNTSINVYDEISVADVETFMGKTEEERINMIMKTCKS